VVFCLSFGSIMSALKFTSRSMTLVWPLEAAQSNGVHRTSFLDVKTKSLFSFLYSTRRSELALLAHSLYMYLSSIRRVRCTHLVSAPLLTTFTPCACTHIKCDFNLILPRCPFEAAVFSGGRGHSHQCQWAVCSN
jgi:hypothetical protein